MTTAFVLSGGGSLGAVQVGMAAALAERGRRPDLLIGTSAGALNAAYLAAGGFDVGSVDRLGAIWRRTRRADVFPVDPLRHFLALGGRRVSLCSPAPLQRLIAGTIGHRRFDDVRVPLHVVATDVLSGEEVLLSDGDIPSAVLASAAIPAVFPAVERGGRTLIDGGVADNAAVSQAVAMGADHVVVLPAGYACALAAPPATALSAAIHALTLLIQQRLIVEIAHLADRAEIEVLPPLCPLTVSSADFRRAESLMDRAYRATGDWLDSGRGHGRHPERVLGLHHHGPGQRPQVVTAVGSGR